MPSAPRPSQDAPTIIADRYRVIEQLGCGGMATVYLAAMDGPGGFGKLVAIKRIHPHLATQDRFVDMFLDEARIVSRIDHPNVCTVLDFGQTDTTYFLAMEYIMGETLLGTLRALSRRRELIGTGQWNAFAAYLIAEACEGLHHAHELCDEFGKPLGIVHRDVSPDNIFLSYQGEVKVMDFGIARAEGRLHQTSTGVVKGKVRYMAPESLHGERDVDRRVDVWALGVCLWELLTGKSLYRRPTEMATIAAIVLEETPTPSSRVPSIPAELEAIVMAALERDREARTASARDMGRALRQFISNSGVAMDRIECAELIGALHADSKAEKLAQRAQLRQQVSRPASAHDARPGTHDPIPTLATDAPAAQPASATAAEPSRPPKRRAWLVALAGLLLLGGVGAGFAVASLRGEQAPESAPEAVAEAENPPHGTAAEPSLLASAEPAQPPESDLAKPEEEQGRAGADDETAAAGDSAGDGADDTDDRAAEEDERRTSSSRRRRSRRVSKDETPASTSDREAPSIAKDTATDKQPAEPKDVAVADSAPEPKEPAITPAEPVVDKPLPLPVAPPRPTSFKAGTSITNLRARGSLSTATVKPAVTRTRSSLAGCYEKAAKKAGRNATTRVAVELVIDESRRARKISATGGSLPGLDECVEDVVKGVRSTEAPDVGDARVSFTVEFKPAGK